ncbi:MAG: intradiol ring-cleavage dioxygenase [Bacteroidota bacterium]|nr:intradiol ring-cleavage dioxygenase [Bacteroidota bacterium]
MDSDDRPVGRILSRREIMQIFGAAFLVSSGSDVVRKPTSAMGKTALPPCIVRPEQTEGPFFADLELDRSDIRTEPSTGAFLPGLPLELTFQVSRVGNEECAPLPGARVDVWQCDAEGRYSAFQDRRAGGDLRGEKFLRGYQLTDASGMARFTTIYPGWYRGRAVHIHFKIRTEVNQGSVYEFTSQLYFDDELSDQVFAKAPYAARGVQTTRNSNDGIFRRTGENLMLDLSPNGEGYQATFGIGLDLSDTETGSRDSNRRSRRSN